MSGAQSANSGPERKPDTRPERFCSYCGRRSRIVAIGSKCLMRLEAGDPYRNCPGRYREEPTP